MAKKKEIAVGGQAVIEGVMMRGPEYIATAVRRKDKTIEIKKEEFVSITKKKKILGLPILRGFTSLIEMMILGFTTLSFSAKRFELDLEEEEKEKNKDKKKKKEKKEKSKNQEKAGEFLSFAFALLLGFFLFAFTPYKIAELLKMGKESLYFNIIAGSIRIVFFVLYVWIISFMKDVKRLFQYHGAEHKSVFAYENNAKLVPEKVQDFTTLHPRCGTSFMFFVLLISILIFSITDFLFTLKWGAPSLFVRLGYHFLLIPIISGISYEVLRLSGKNINHPLVKMLTTPGMALQKITTQPPDNEQVEVAILAMKAALEIDIEESENIIWLED